MRLIAANTLTALLLLACASPAPSPSPSPVPSPLLASAAPSTDAAAFWNSSASPAATSSGLRVGAMAVVTAGQLRQVADPNQPADRAFESSSHAGERVLRPLGEAQRVMIVGGPTQPNDDVYWQVADAAFPGCCAPFGWVRGADGADQPVLAPFAPECPDRTDVVSGNELLALGLMEAQSCFGRADFKLRGEVRCAPVTTDGYIAIAGPQWTHERTSCNIDQAVALYGAAVTQLSSAEPGNGIRQGCRPHRSF